MQRLLGARPQRVQREVLSWHTPIVFPDRNVDIPFKDVGSKAPPTWLPQWKSESHASFPRACDLDLNGKRVGEEISCYQDTTGQREVVPP